MLSISADWETTSDGLPEERACFAAITIRAGDICLTEGHDPFVGRIRQAPLLSGYHLAEWLIWNWWRLRWEPRSRKPDWAFAHRLATGGAGYVWPNLTFLSDGQRVAIIAEPSRDQGQGGYRYIADRAVVLPGGDFENAIERFVAQVAGQLDAEGLAGSNFDRLRADLTHERQNPALSKFRKIEALMGYDPDEAPMGMVERFIAAEAALGTSATTELAAESGDQSKTTDVFELRALAATRGFTSSPRDALHVEGQAPLDWSRTPAWLAGQTFARAARTALRLQEEPIGDESLTHLVAVDVNILDGKGGAPFSFAFGDGADSERIVLRSRWRTGRRFELARLLGDRLAAMPRERLTPATRSQTYRQKLQRAFAAEFLSPFEAVEAMMDGDYSDERQQDAAERYDVSPLTIRSLLVNHRRIGRDELEPDVDLPPQNTVV